MGDGVGERLEGLAVGARVETQGTHRADQGAEHRVGAGQVRNDVLAHRVRSLPAPQCWQCGQWYVERCPWVMARTAVPQRRQGLPARS